MSAPKQLSTLAVATLTTGIVMVEGMAGVYEAAEWIMGHPVWTHELPAASKRIADLVVAEHPDFPVVVDGAWEDVRDALLARYGETIAMPEGAESRKAGPISTLQAMMDARTPVADGEGRA